MPSPTLTGSEQTIIVGIAELAVSDNRNVILTAHALGAGIAVSIYDPQTKIGGLLHIMLPDSSIDPAKAAAQPAMFMDSGLSALFRAASELKAEEHRLQICVAGGAQIMDDSGVFNVGNQNYESAIRILKGEHGLRVQAAHVGGFASRSVALNIATGEVRLKLSGQSAEMTLWKS